MEATKYSSSSRILIALRGFELTGLGVHREVRLALQDAVHHPSAVPVRGVVCVCGCHLNYRGAWGKKIHDNDLDQLFNTAENCLRDNWLS